MYLERAPTYEELFDRLEIGEIVAALKAPVDPRAGERYPHWDKLKRLQPPPGLSTEQWWLKIKGAREGDSRALPLTDSTGKACGYGLVDSMLRQLRYIDQRCGGEVAMDEVVTSERKAAKEMLRSGREPRDRGERMIANNYAALQFMREEMGKKLTPAGILDLHRILTAGTLDDPAAAGRLQRAGEPRVAVFDRDDGQPIHKPPPADQLPERMRMLCNFANEGEESEPFIHPVIRAILLHFWLAYDHPFEDGNGRTARILFALADSIGLSPRPTCPSA